LNSFSSRNLLGLQRRAGQLSRYRAAKQEPALKKVDEAFWSKFQAVSSGRELEVQSCYEK
jgi:hypothetical protein